MKMSQYSSTLTPGLGFSYGWARWSLGMPPPLFPSSSMGVIEATGPPGTVWVRTGAPAGSRYCTAEVGTVRRGCRFWITPWEIRKTAATSEMGNRMRTTERTVSTQKLPRVVDFRRISPRISATTTALPMAPARNCGTTRDTSCERGLIVDSPEYDCQLVVVRKLTAVLNDSPGPTAFMWSGFSGRWAWRRITA